MRSLIFNPEDLPLNAADKLPGIEAEPVSLKALLAGASALGENSLLPLLLVAEAAAQSTPVAAGVVRNLRRAGFKGPVVVLLKGSAPQAGIALLDAGADDVLTIPVRAEELRARLYAISRRISGLTQPVVTLGAMEFYLDGRNPDIAGETVRLSAKEYEILRYLALNAGKVVSKSAIYDALYALSPLPPFDKIIDVYICRLRSKINQSLPAGLGYIETVPGRGYRLKAPACNPVNALAQQSTAQLSSVM